jgi:hypothetical protein
VLGTVLARTLPEGRRSLAKCGEMRGLVLSRSVGEIFSQLFQFWNFHWVDPVHWQFANQVCSAIIAKFNNGRLTGIAAFYGFSEIAHGSNYGPAIHRSRLKMLLALHGPSRDAVICPH